MGKVKRISALNLVVLFFSLSVSFAENNQHFIDKAEEECIAKDSSTAGMNNCSYEARNQWDAEMNKFYRLLMDRLDAEESAKLKQAQRAWIKFRDYEFEYINAVYHRPMVGSLYTNIAAADKREVVKKRALELEGYYHILLIRGTPP